MKDLGALGGPTATSLAVAINALGQIVGTSVIKHDQRHAFLYTISAGMKDLGTFADSQGIASRLNDAGVVVGITFVAGKLTASTPLAAFVCDTRQGMRALGTLGGPSSTALGINRLGEVVGAADCRNKNGTVPTHAFLYSKGQMIDLNLAVQQAGGWTLVCANAINDAGQIAGFGSPPGGGLRAFLLTPVEKDKEMGREGVKEK